MFKTVLILFYMLNFWHVFSMQDPCKAWKDMMRQTCNTGVLNRLLEKQAREQAKKARCSTVRMAGPRECQKLIEQTGANVQCPHLVAVVGSMPYYRFDECYVTNKLK